MMRLDATGKSLFVNCDYQSVAPAQRPKRLQIYDLLEMVVTGTSGLCQAQTAARPTLQPATQPTGLVQQFLMILASQVRTWIVRHLRTMVGA